MNAKEASFTYFRYPHRFSTYTSEPKLCFFCKQELPGYDGPFYGTNHIEFVCEECLAAGKLAIVGAKTNEGDRESLCQQIKEAHPELENSQIETLAAPKLAELEQRTPHAITWQDFLWPAHCGDFCCYIKEAGRPDLLDIAPGSQMHPLINLQNDDQFSKWWDDVRPDLPVDTATPYSMGVYLFQCLNCREYIVLWDSEMILRILLLNPRVM